MQLGTFLVTDSLMTHSRSKRNSMFIEKHSNTYSLNRSGCMTPRCHARFLRHRLQAEAVLVAAAAQGVARALEVNEAQQVNAAPPAVQQQLRHRARQHKRQ